MRWAAVSEGIIDDGLAKVRHILSSERVTLVALSERLLESEVMDADEFREIIDETSPSPKIVPGTESIVPGGEPERPRSTEHDANDDDEPSQVGG